MGLEKWRSEESKSENGLLDYVRKFWGNLKDSISSFFSVKKESTSKLDTLKEDISTAKDDSKDKQSSSENSLRTEVASASNVWTVSESKEKDTWNLRETLLKVVSRGRKPESVNKNDNWFVSIWMLQRHWDKTVTLLKQFRDHNPARFKSIMTDPLFNNLEKAGKSVWNDTHVKQFSELMKDSWCVQIQKDMALKTVVGYLDFVKGLWVSDPRATLAFWRICNYWIWHAKKVKNNMVKAGADINDYSQVIDYYEKSVSWVVRTKFQKKYAVLWNKNLREFIWEYQW